MPFSVRLFEVSFLRNSSPSSRSCSGYSLSNKLLHQLIHAAGGWSYVAMSCRLMMQAWGKGAAAGVAAAQVVSGACRVICCCAVISNDLHIHSLQQKQQQSTNTPARSAPAVAKSGVGHRSGCAGSYGSKRCEIATRVTDNARDSEPLAANSKGKIAFRSWLFSSILRFRKALEILMPPGSGDMLSRYGCCFVIAAALQAAMRGMAIEVASNMNAAESRGYNSMHLLLWGRVVPLWKGEVVLGLTVCVSAVAMTGPVLVLHVRKAYLAAAAANGSKKQT